ncbi:TraR/DksA family transcriptional regulator [Yersinia massiliensis]|uniref:TraR/DksA family transcriptional regulator n=1 Tax=Yersinia massiliensis TaxID=419257 RepID=UPI0011A8C5C7|nr:TraR/DksA family transcriptional regulator [Yersinia massiliensis]
MDSIDIANEHAERMLELNLKKVLNKQAIPAAHVCDVCGVEIPEERRKAVPNVQLCVDCKTIEEQRNKKR